MSKVRLQLNNTSGGNNNNGKGDENTKIEMRKIITLAKNDNDDKGVIMVNINRYYPEADYPNGKLYKEYMGVLSQLLNEAGGKILWRLPIKGTVIGKEEKYHEMFAAFYPSHSAFLQLSKSANDSKIFKNGIENFRLRNFNSRTCNYLSYISFDRIYRVRNIYLFLNFVSVHVHTSKI